MLYYIVIRLARFFAKVFYRHKTYGKRHILPGAAILAANHVSYLDPPVLSLSCPEDVYFLARKTLFKGAFGKFIYALNARPVQIGGANLEVFREIGALLQQGKKVVLFPEGTRSVDGNLTEFKPGIFLLMSRTGCAVQPAYIYGTFTIWGKSRGNLRSSGRRHAFGEVPSPGLVTRTSRKRKRKLNSQKTFAHRSYALKPGTKPALGALPP